MADVWKSTPLLTASEAASKLAEVSGIAACEIRLALRTFGYLDVVPGLKFILDLAVSLRTRFLLLQEAFPNLDEVLRRFLLAEQLASSLSEIEFGESIAGRWKKSNLDGLFDDPTKGLDRKPPDEITKDFLAVIWLFQSLEALETAPVTRLGHLDIRTFSLAYQHDVWDGAPEIAQGLLASGFSTWSDAVARTTEDPLFHSFRGFKSAIERAASIVPRILHFPSVLPSKPAIALTEQRALSQANLNFPRPSEIESLHKAMAELDQLGSLSPLFHEKLVIGLGLATGRTVRDVLNMRIVGAQNIPTDPEEQIIALVLAPGFNGHHLRADWLIPVPRGRPLVFPLPERFSRPCNIHPRATAAAPNGV